MYEEVSPGRLRFPMFALYECPSEGDDQQELNVPQAVLKICGSCIAIEGVQLCVELLFVEQMHQLSTMKFYGVYEKYSVVDAWYNRCVRLRQAASAILRFVCMSARHK